MPPREDRRPGPNRGCDGPSTRQSDAGCRGDRSCGLVGPARGWACLRSRSTDRPHRPRRVETRLGSASGGPPCARRRVRAGHCHRYGSARRPRRCPRRRRTGKHRDRAEPIATPRRRTGHRGTIAHSLDRTLGCTPRRSCPRCRRRSRRVRSGSAGTRPCPDPAPRDVRATHDDPRDPGHQDPHAAVRAVAVRRRRLTQRGLRRRYRRTGRVLWRRVVTGFVRADPVLRGKSLFVGTSGRLRFGPRHLQRRGLHLGDRLRRGRRVLVHQRPSFVRPGRPTVHSCCSRPRTGF